MVRLALILSLLWLSCPSFAQLGKPLPPGYLQWSATRHLQPSDFQLRMRPQNNLNQSMGRMGLQMDGIVGDLFGKKANRVVQNVFHSAGSYLDSTGQPGVALQIRYIQTLWNINEVAARHLRQDLRANAKRMLLIGKPDLNDLFRVASENASKRQIQYADETNFGLFLDKQEAWEGVLISELAELAAFAIPD
jgi:hypothetical protein